MDGVTAEGVWIDLRDYALRGVRKEKVRERPTDFGLPPPPDTWVDLRAFTVGGVRSIKKKKIVALPPPPPMPPPTPAPVREPPPPEHYLTVFQAVEELYSVLDPHGHVYQELDRLLAVARQRHQEGVLSVVEVERFNQAMSEIRLAYAQGLDRVVDWYLENFFRMFHTEPHDPP
ncbi:MAG: hypothetical protein HQL63_04825 [Magnetococcales bacterium]|nr:hypothetical protein [Magnetococcales bacterium]